MWLDTELLKLIVMLSLLLGFEVGIVSYIGISWISNYLEERHHEDD